MTDLWWNKHYKYRKQVLFDMTKGDLSGHRGRIYLPKSSVTNGKIRPDFLDIRVVFNGVTVINDQNFLIENHADYVKVIFYYPHTILDDYDKTVDDRCYIYYGDTFAESPEATLPLEPLPDIGDIDDDYTLGTLDINDFPDIITLGTGDPRIGLTNPGKDWVLADGVIATPKNRVGAKLSFEFYGDAVGLYSYPASFQGMLDITIDDDNYELDLFSVGEDWGLVFVATNLDDSLHHLVIENKGKRNEGAISLNPEFALGVAGDEVVRKWGYEALEEITILGYIGYSAYAVGQPGTEESVDEFKWNSRIGGII